MSGFCKHPLMRLLRRLFGCGYMFLLSAMLIGAFAVAGASACPVQVQQLSIAAPQYAVAVAAPCAQAVQVQAAQVVQYVQPQVLLVAPLYQPSVVLLRQAQAIVQVNAGQRVRVRKGLFGTNIRIR